MFHWFGKKVSGEEFVCVLFTIRISGLIIRLLQEMTVNAAVVPA